MSAPFVISHALFNLILDVPTKGHILFLLIFSLMNFLADTWGASIAQSLSLQAGCLGFSCWQSRIFLFATISRLALTTTQPPIQRVHGPSPSFSSKLKNVWRYTSTPHTSVCHGNYLSTRSSFTFILCD
jgi:hypothetical protein